MDRPAQTPVVQSFDERRSAPELDMGEMAWNQGLNHTESSHGTLWNDGNGKDSMLLKIQKNYLQKRHESSGIVDLRMASNPLPAGPRRV